MKDSIESVQAFRDMASCIRNDASAYAMMLLLLLVGMVQEGGGTGLGKGRGRVVHQESVGTCNQCLIVDS